ncbi:MAG: peptide chain release factor H [Pseudomonadota bacterium]
MILLQFSAAQGPDECCLAVTKAMRYFINEALQAEVKVDIAEQENGNHSGTFRSVLLSLEGNNEEKLANDWAGTLQWICSSPYRSRHLRKNWFIGVARCESPAPSLVSEIYFETMRASGPGGQHINKTETAVRATHIATGISVKVQSERSQHANKKLAVSLVAHKLACREKEIGNVQRADRRLMHYQLERGNPKKIFKGEAFILMPMV